MEKSHDKFHSVNGKRKILIADEIIKIKPIFI